MALVTLQTICQDALPAYEQTHPLPAHVRKAARAIMQCRTAALGGHIHACPDGHVARVWDHACRHRSCPQCAYLQTERWLRLQQARLWACAHYHGIFPLPHDLNPLWLAHVPVMSALLLQPGRDTLSTLLADPQYLGAQPGIIAALHPWSQTLVLHPHLHGLVTGGGRTPGGTWVAVRNGVLLPLRVVMAVLRGKMVDAIRQTCTRGALVLPEPLRPQQCVNRLHRLGHPTQTRWHVRIMERYRHGAGVVTSLARSLRGGSLKHARLVGLGWGRCHLHLSRAWGGVGGRGTPPAAYDLAGRRLAPAVAAARAGSPHAGGAVVGALPSCPHRGAGPLPRRARATACGAPTKPGLADRVCPTGRRPSGTVSHLRSAPGVYRRHPAWRCPAACPGEGVRSMRPTHDRRWGEVWQGVGCRASALWWSVRIAVAVVGRGMGVAHPRPCRRPHCWWRPQAG